MPFFSPLIAQVIGNPALNQTNVVGSSFVSGLLPAIINLFFIAGSIFFFFNALIGGIRYTSSGGDKGSLETARNHITNALMGISVLFVTYVIIGVIEYIFCVNLIFLDLESLRLVPSTTGGGAACN